MRNATAPQPPFNVVSVAHIQQDGKRDVSVGVQRNQKLTDLFWSSHFLTNRECCLMRNLLLPHDGLPVFPTLHFHTLMVIPA